MLMSHRWVCALVILYIFFCFVVEGIQTQFLPPSNTGRVDHRAPCVLSVLLCVFFGREARSGVVFVNLMNYAGIQREEASKLRNRSPNSSSRSNRRFSGSKKKSRNRSGGGGDSGLAVAAAVAQTTANSKNVGSFERAGSLIEWLLVLNELVCQRLQRNYQIQVAPIVTLEVISFPCCTCA
jgi:hypothetical protein